jgi:hypothetical protein
VLLIPLLSVPVALLYWRRRYLECLVFSVHFCTFWILWILVFLSAVTLVAWMLHAWHVNAGPALSDITVTGVIALVSGVYLSAAFRRTFGGRRWTTVFRAIVLALLLLPFVDLYRSILFLVTLWST